MFEALCVHRGTILNITNLPFGVTNWAGVEKTEHSGEQGVAYWRTRNFGDIRVRMVEYSPGSSYQVADNAELHRSSTELGTKLFVVD